MMWLPGQRLLAALVIVVGSLFLVLAWGTSPGWVPQRATAESPPGWALTGYEDVPYTYTITEQTGTATVSVYLYDEPYRDEVIYKTRRVRVRDTWESVQTGRTTTAAAVWRCYPPTGSVPALVDCHQETWNLTTTTYDIRPKAVDSAVQWPVGVMTYTRPIYGSVQVPVFQQVQRQDICRKPLYSFVGGNGSVVDNGDGTVSVWVPTVQCVNQPWPHAWVEKQVSRVATGTASRKQLVSVSASMVSGSGATIQLLKAQQEYAIPAYSSYGSICLVSSGRCQYMSSGGSVWQEAYSFQCSGRYCSYTGREGPYAGYTTYTFYRSPDPPPTYPWVQVLQDPRISPGCSNSGGCTFVVRVATYDRLSGGTVTHYRYASSPAWQYYWDPMLGYYVSIATVVRDVNIVAAQQYESRQETVYRVQEQRSYATQTWTTYAATTTDIQRSEMVDRYVPEVSWQQVRVPVPAVPQVSLSAPDWVLTGDQSSFVLQNVPATVGGGSSSVPARLVLDRVEWDLDGNGTVDRVTVGTSLDYTYPAPGTYTVTARAVYRLQLQLGTAFVDVGTRVAQASRTHVVSDTPPNSGWVLSGFQNQYYTYDQVELVGYQTYTQYLYMQPVQDRVVYTPEQRLLSRVWQSQLTSRYPYTITLASCAYAYEPPWPLQCSYTTMSVVRENYTPVQVDYYGTVQVPQVITDYVPVYGSIQVPVYRTVQRTGVCTLPVYTYTGSTGQVALNPDGTVTMWVPQTTCVPEAVTQTYQVVNPQVVPGPRQCRQQLQVTLNTQTTSQTVNVYTYHDWRVERHYYCSPIKVCSWTTHDSDCSYDAGWCPQVGFTTETSGQSPDGLYRWTRTEYHPPCPDCHVTCTLHEEWLVCWEQQECGNYYDTAVEYVLTAPYTNTYYNYFESRSSITQCWDTYVLQGVPVTMSSTYTVYRPVRRWNLVNLPVPSFPQVNIGINPGTVGLTGLPSWFWVEGVSSREAVGPNNIRTRIVPSHYQWDFNGDGVVDLVTTSAGRPYPYASDIQYTYQRSSLSQTGRTSAGLPAYIVGLEVVYRLQVSMDSGWQDLGYITQRVTRPYPVQQLQSVVGQ